MFRERKSIFAPRCHRVEIEEMRMPNVGDEYPQPIPEPVPIKKKKGRKCLPGERLLRELHRKEKERGDNLDMSMLQKSIAGIIDDICDCEMGSHRT